MKKLLIIAFILPLAVFTGCKSTEMTAEQMAKAGVMAGKIETPRFTFSAINAQPTGGRTVNLTSAYEVKITPDTIQVYLPYFGRAYTAPIGNNEGGIRFTSTDFEYTSEKKRNGTYEITITPHDIENNNMLTGLVMRLSAGVTGYGTLSVQSTNRQNISFYGTIE